MEYQKLRKSGERISAPVQRAAAAQSAAMPNSALASIMRGNRPNKTGLPDAMKARMERVTGVPLDDVHVSRNSNKPAGLGAAAYTKGNEIVLGPGQEKHLTHELGHVVQQKLGLVRANFELEGEKINDDASLERAADNMLSGPELSPSEAPTQLKAAQDGSEGVVQRELIVVGGAQGTQTQLIGINAMPSTGTRTWFRMPDRLLSSGIKNIGGVIAGHSSVVSGDLAGNAQIRAFDIHGAEGEAQADIPAARKGSITGMTNVTAHGFSPDGFWNSLKVGAYDKSFGLLGSKSVPGRYHDDHDVTSDRTARTLTTRVTPETRQLWDNMAAQALDAQGTRGVYSFMPNTMDADDPDSLDNCTTIALRRAHTLCNEVLGELPPEHADRANVEILLGEINRLIEAVSDRVRVRGGEEQDGLKMQGRLMGALANRYGRQSWKWWNPFSWFS